MGFPPRQCPISSRTPGNLWFSLSRGNSRKCGQSCVLVLALGLLPAGLPRSHAVLRGEKPPSHGCEPHTSSCHVCLWFS